MSAWICKVWHVPLCTCAIHCPFGWFQRAWQAGNVVVVPILHLGVFWLNFTALLLGRWLFHFISRLGIADSAGPLFANFQKCGSFSSTFWKDENYCGKRVTLAGNKNRCSDFPIMWDFRCIQRKHWMIQFRSDTLAPLAIAPISLQVVMLTQMHRTFYTNHDARHYSRLTALWLVHNYTQETSWSCKCCRLTWGGINTFPYDSEKHV